MLDRVKLLICCIVLVIFWNTPANAQATYGAIVGTLRDNSGAVVPAVTVTVRNERTGETFTSRTNEVGAYAFNTLLPDTYSIHAELSGFRPVDVRNIVLQVNQTARFDLMLEVGELAETVEVIATVPVLSTDTSDVGQVINNKQIVDLPLNGRNFMQLAALTNGVILSGDTESGGPNFLSHGGRPTQNSFLVEGVETRIQREGRYGLNLSVDAIGEFKVMQNAFSAEYGRATTIVNATIKTGGNDFHGSVFEFLRNDRLDSRNAFDLTGTKPPLRFNQFGASVGGPIRRDKTFFFLNWESQRVRRGSTRFETVPTPVQLQGDLSDMATAVDPTTREPFPNNRIPSDRILPYGQAAAGIYPTPTGSPLAGTNFVAVLNDPVDMDQFSGRVDHALSDKDRISGHITFFEFENTNVGTLPFHGNKGFSKVKPNLSVRHTRTFSPSLLNTFQVGYSYTDTFNGADELLDRDVTAEWGLQNLSPVPASYGPPETIISGFGSIGHGPWKPNGAIDRSLQVNEQVAYIKGRHSMKFGTDMRWLRYDDLGFAIQNGSQAFTGLFSENALADMLLGLPARGFAHTAGPGSQFTFFTRNGEYSLYFQDDIKLTPNLTLNAGLRYEYVQWPVEIDDNFGVWNFERGTLDFAGVDIPRRTADPDRNNFGPRLGLAYTPDFSKKTVIRAGAGITYGNYRQWEVSLLHFQPPFVFGNFLFNDPTAPFTTSDLYPDVPDRREDIDLGQTALAGAAAFQDSNKVLPITYQWNFAIQHEILPSFLLEVGYVGNRSEKQPNRWDANAAVPDKDPLNPTPIQSRRPYQNASFVTANTWRAWSNYNALTVRAERRFTSGFALLGTYTWSKAMAIRGHDNWTVMDINDIRLNYGPANDFAHRAVISYVYELPFGPGKAVLGNAGGALAHLIGGWQVNGITTFRSGAALRLTSPVSNNLGNRAGNKPNRIADGNLPTSRRTVERWFDTSAFVDPVVGRYGNAGEGIIRGPGLVNWDLSLFKNAKITEQKTLQFRFEFFNAFNNVNLDDPSASTGSARFGAITGAGLAREIQVGLKFLF